MGQKFTDHIVGADFVIGTESANVINLGIQLKSSGGGELAQRGAVQFYLSDDANGDSIASAPDTVAIGTDGLAVEIGTDLWQLISEVDGDIDLDITEAGGADTFYGVVILPNGELVVSSAITFAA